MTPIPPKAKSLHPGGRMGFGFLLRRCRESGRWFGGPASLFFIAAGRLGPGKEVDPEQRSLWQWAQSGGVMLPFALMLYFASRAELGEHLYPIAGLLLILCAAAAWIDRVDQFPMLPLGAAAASVAVFLVWSGKASFDVALSWEAVGVAVALALVFHGRPWL